MVLWLEQPPSWMSIPTPIQIHIPPLLIIHWVSKSIFVWRSITTRHTKIRMLFWDAGTHSAWVLSSLMKPLLASCWKVLPIDWEPSLACLSKLYIKDPGSCTGCPEVHSCYPCGTWHTTSRFDCNETDEQFFRFAAQVQQRLVSWKQR